MDRASQLNLLIQTQAGHGDMINFTKVFVNSRRVQSDILKTYGHLCDKAAVLLLGSGDGAEAESICDTVGVDQTQLYISAMELSRERADKFKKRFPCSEILMHDFSDGNFEFSEKKGKFDLIQCGFVLNDQTEQGKRAICKSAFEYLRPGGLFLVAEIFLEKFPNIRARWVNAECEATVNLELAEYYQDYLDQLIGFTDFSNEERYVFESSINKAWSEARAHQDGREAFDTKESFLEILEGAGFSKIHFIHAYKKCWVVSAFKPNGNT